ncbi:type II toxin-antitoxin system ParD family antitoxin [Cognatiyoonia sp. IB215182]|uniref:ribbon-helix-helix domain-containing protein n=1 Tax=Cognatiyoonia sp. IB215182 TaxID=3097353 RepID=UPI002A0E1086|nr:type II toxin-antitoxin system ParD family antitoxin [Cognatiyoonia sp. IB215182]MDX8355779.1 type II toxin-antitoxin system ParD family antitoxin [Cognatiyoonia sp. IB215182]
MSVKASVSISEQQDAYVRDLVNQGRFSSMSAVVQQGLDLLRKQEEMELLETAALKVLLEERKDGQFLSSTNFARQTDDMIKRKRQDLGLDG